VSDALGHAAEGSQHVQADPDEDPVKDRSRPEVRPGFRSVGRAQGYAPGGHLLPYFARHAGLASGVRRRRFAA